MAHYQEVDYCSEEVRSVASPAGFGRHGGVQQHVVREKFEEVDRVSRTGSHGRHHGHHGHHGHGHGSGNFVMRETTVEEDFNTCTGEFHERKESYVVRSD
ncbi:hypothetical protein SETIT_5G423200v2 [Setaria italica]|uniref:Uncharacterized protein n=1 Tax=Setaria italica TaxID=4555 RepID=K3XNJ5_SETIT|nr:uncharacterized protein LOC101772049 [Setaria italica]RCV28697.1 hypothetical protein SETIT_5G423200v2 [Setaria italica]